MRSRKLAWGWGGAVLMAFLAGCSGSLNDVGNAMGGSSNEGGDESETGTAGTGKQPRGGSGGTGEIAGAGGTGEIAGAGGTGYVGGYGGTGHYGGDGGTGYYGGESFGGVAGTGYYGGSGGGFNCPSGCFDIFRTCYDEDALDLAPQNTVLLDIHNPQMQAVNSAGQLVFPNSYGGQWEMYANFPAVSPELASKTDISLPAELGSLPDNLAQLYVTRRSCEGQEVGGHKLVVEVWWKGVAGAPPTHGMALGTYDKKTRVTTWLSDATKTFVVGGAAAKRLMDTLNRIQLAHTFAAGDKTDARQIVLGLWLASGDVVPTTFYVGNVIWD
ncbi:MAG TPA: hypothetical protein VJN18_02010 [Polyangiaceae bacterium]|nr:hypothetical protein [Polyangiaceae bacterium]